LALIISTGGAQEENSISLQWTIGELLVEDRISESRHSVQEGFHQLFIIDRDLDEEAKIRADVFPNPVGNLVDIIIENEGTITYTLFDSSGRLVKNEGQFQNRLQLDMTDFPAAIYFLHVKNLENGFSKTLSLLKI
jgi:hypothetical protein